VGLWLDCNFRIPPQEEEEFTSNRLNKLFRGRRAGKYRYLVMGLSFEHWWLTKIIIFLMNIKNSTIIPIKTPFLRKKLDEKFSSVTPSARKYKRNGRGVPLYGKLSVLEIFSGTLERCKRVFLDNSRHNDVARKAIDERLNKIQSLKNLCDEEEICKLILTDSSEAVRARAIEALAAIKCKNEASSDFSQSDVAPLDASGDFIESVNEIRRFLLQFEHVDIENVQSLVRSAIIKNPELKYEWRTLLKDEDTVDTVRCIVPYSATLIDIIRNETLE
jgi:hypothetical protein